MPGRPPMLQSQFIENARSRYGDKFDYSLVVYVNSSTKVKIVCPLHGVFEQRPTNHLTCKEGCYQCGKDRAGLNHRMTQDEFVARANQIHYGAYDYSKTVYVGAFLPIQIRCPKHGVFSQVPNDHLYGRCGCVKCGYERGASRGELAIRKWLEQKGLTFAEQVQFDGLVGNKGHPLRYDFHLPNENIIIEFDGPHHNEPIRYSGTSEEAAIKTHQLTVEYDSRKEQFAEEKGMRIIRIPYEQLKNVDTLLSSFVPCPE